MRKIEQKEFCERYDARRTFYNCQMKVPQVSSKLETLLANSKIECRELYENQMEKITGKYPHLFFHPLENQGK